MSNIITRIAQTHTAWRISPSHWRVLMMLI